MKDPSDSIAFNGGVSGDPNQGFATVPVNALWVLVKQSSSMNLDISLALISLYRTTIWQVLANFLDQALLNWDLISFSDEIALGTWCYPSVR